MEADVNRKKKEWEEEKEKLVGLESKDDLKVEIK